MDERKTLDGNDIETVGTFSYLRDILSTEEGVQEAVTSRIRFARKKFKDLSSILCEKGMSLRIKGILCKSYVQSTLSYGAECWAVMKKDEKTEDNRSENVTYIMWQNPEG